MIKVREYSPVSHSYAEALFRAARRLGVVERVSEECQVLSEAIGRTPNLAVFLHSPQIATDEKLAFLGRTLSSRVSTPLARMLELLVERDRAGELLDILDLVQELVERSQGIHPAKLQSAAELTAQERQQLTTALEKYTGNRLHIEYSVDPTLIGGVVFRFHDMLIDTSISSGLAELRRRLMGTSLAGEGARS